MIRVSIGISLAVGGDVKGAGYSIRVTVGLDIRARARAKVDPRAHGEGKLVHGLGVSRVGCAAVQRGKAHLGTYRFG